MSVLFASSNEKDKAAGMDRLLAARTCCIDVDVAESETKDAGITSKVAFDAAFRFLVLVDRLGAFCFGATSGPVTNLAAKEADLVTGMSSTNALNDASNESLVIHRTRVTGEDNLDSALGQE
jgi:hypothetical protein